MMEKKNTMLELLKSKNTAANIQTADTIAKVVHTTPSVEGETKRISLNTPIDMYMAIKEITVKKRTNLMQYILKLVQEDIEREKREGVLRK